MYVCNPKINIEREQSVVESSASLKPERFSNFQKTSAEKKFETCGLRNLGKLIIVACWIPLKGRQLLTEARLTKTPSVSSRPRQIAEISLFLNKLTTTTTICFAVGFVLWTWLEMLCVVHILNSDAISLHIFRPTSVCPFYLDHQNVCEFIFKYSRSIV